MSKAWKALDAVAGWTEEHAERKRENNRAILRALHTPGGMLVLGAILLFIAVMLLIDSRVEQQESVNNVIVSGVDVGTGFIITTDGDSTVEIEELSPEEAYTPPNVVMEILREEEEKEQRRERVEAVISVLCGAVSLAYAAFLWIKKKNKAAESAGAGTIPAESTSEREESREDIPTAVENAEIDSREARLESLKRLYAAGILSRDEYQLRKRKIQKREETE